MEERDSKRGERKRKQVWRKERKREGKKEQKILEEVRVERWAKKEYIVG